MSMKPTTAIIEFVRTISDGDVSSRLDRLEVQLASEPLTDAQAAAAIRHLETVGFKLEGSGRFGEAARVYGLASELSRWDHGRWRNLANYARLRDLIGRALWEEASCIIAQIRQTNMSGTAIQDGVKNLLDLGWYYECRYAAEAAVQCYRLAFEFNGGDAGVATGDATTISTKIRNLRVLQMNHLAENGRHEEAAALHERTRAITGLGAVGIYDIVSASQATVGGRGAYHEILPGRSIAEPEVKFLDGPVALTSEAGSLNAPPQYIALFKDCLTFPRSNVVIHGKRLIYDLAAHPRNTVAEIRDGVNPDQIMQAVYGAGRALVEMPDTICELDAGLMMFGFQSRNYGHWILEFVPRMLWFNHPACPSDFPICIDDHMPETHRQIVELLDERDRQILPLHAQATRFRELALAPVPTFFPFDCKPDHPVYDTIWPSDILSSLRSKVLSGLASHGVDLRPTGRRIFLSRRDFDQRKLLNESDIVDALQSHNFEVIYPEQISFAEQVAIYHAADIIVGSASSALTNCIFCNPNAKVIALIHEARSFNFRGYTSMIRSSGADLIFIRGKAVTGATVHAFHANYVVEPALVIRSLQNSTQRLEKTPSKHPRAGNGAPH